MERQRLLYEEEADPQWRLVGPGSRLPSRLGCWLVALGYRLLRCAPGPAASQREPRAANLEGHVL
jgi:hypothetical protein